MLTMDVNFIHYRQITLYGTFSSAPRHNILALEMIRSGKIHVDSILTHAVSLENILRGFELVQRRAGMRVAVIPHLELVQEDLARHAAIQVI